MNIWNPVRITWSHRANPVVKLGLICALFFMTVLTHDLDFVLYQALIFMVCLVVLSGVKPWKMLLFFIPFLLAFISSASSMMLFGKGETIWWEWGCSGYRKKASTEGRIWALRELPLPRRVSRRDDNVLGGFILQPDAEVEACTQVCLQLHGFDPVTPMVWEEYVIRRQALKVRGVRPIRGIRGMVNRAGLYVVPRWHRASAGPIGWPPRWRPSNSTAIRRSPGRIITRRVIRVMTFWLSDYSQLRPLSLMPRPDIFHGSALATCGLIKGLVKSKRVCLRYVSGLFVMRFKLQMLTILLSQEKYLL